MISQSFGRIGRAALTAAQSLISKAFLASGHLLPYDMGSGAAPIMVCTVVKLQTQVRDVSLTNRGGVRR
ncbi:hypothetical protein FXB38_08020 [Bradyrhizobium cytisi]|uniref:Uncharacterized protein n=1 Tax=Bradyrhizobium cytisi TaxID=515489 RepID=A0A5S4XAE8_9BRAD|nr:hypothetical protein FXB38_08020 [Bradyrhizobium cytisi]